MFSKGMIFVAIKTSQPARNTKRQLVVKMIFACICAALALVMPARAEDVTQQSLMQAATELAKQYDTYYNAKNVDGMTKVYASDAILISPSGAIVRGTGGLKPYYQKRFASGAKDHASAITEVHVQRLTAAMASAISR